MSAAVQTARISMDTRVYALETLQKAAIKFTRLASFDFQTRGEHEIEVIVSSNAGIELNAEQFVGQYRNEVLDQHLRQLIARETEAERNLILAHAFSKTRLIQP